MTLTLLIGLISEQIFFILNLYTFFGTPSRKSRKARGNIIEIANEMKVFLVPSENPLLKISCRFLISLLVPAELLRFEKRSKKFYTYQGKINLD